MDLLLKKYLNLVIYRQAFIMLIAAPVPAAAVKLQGTLLDAQTIAFIIIAGNVFAMASMYLNRLGCKALFVGGNVIAVMATGGILGMYLTGVPDNFIIVYFPIMSCLGFTLVGVAAEKIKDRLKNKYGQAFDLAAYSSKKTSVASGAMIVGQVLAVAFYFVVDVNPMLVLVVLECINAALYMVAEYMRWQLVKEMGIDKD